MAFSPAPSDGFRWRASLTAWSSVSSDCGHAGSAAANRGRARSPGSDCCAGVTGGRETRHAAAQSKGIEVRIEVSSRTKTDPESEFILYYNESKKQPSPTINGPVNGKAGVALNFNFTAIDPEDDQIYYFIDWGDDENTGWIGPFKSGEKISKSHTWLTMNNFTVRAKAMDIYYHESNWSTINIKIPKMFIYNSIILPIQKMFEQYSFLKKIFI